LFTQCTWYPEGYWCWDSVNLVEIDDGEATILSAVEVSNTRSMVQGGYLVTWVRDSATVTYDHSRVHLATTTFQVFDLERWKAVATTTLMGENWPVHMGDGFLMVQSDDHLGSTMLTWTPDGDEGDIEYCHLIPEGYTTYRHGNTVYLARGVYGVSSYQLGEKVNMARGS
jgi:hypothetical protein